MSQIDTFHADYLLQIHQLCANKTIIVYLKREKCIILTKIIERVCPESYNDDIKTEGIEEEKGVSEREEKAFCDILAFELKKALGCTEPIAIAYTASVARRALGRLPDQALVRCSGNVIKNAKSVYVPMGGRLKGIEAACLLGAVGGNPDDKLEVLRGIRQEDIDLAKELIRRKICLVEQLDSSEKLHIIVSLKSGDDTAEACVRHTHTGLYRLSKNGEVIFDRETGAEGEEKEPEYRELDLESILHFSEEIDFEKSMYGKRIRELIEEQIRCNTAISEEGLRRSYGAGIGRALFRNNAEDVKLRARAMAAAGSDARMNGCDLPVVINSGSGNQGITVSLPLIEYSRYLKLSHEKLLRALLLSNLTAIYQKHEIGRLSAYCGVVNAAAGAGAGISYLRGGGLREIENTIINTLENISGIVCDGAGESCAAKIASSIDAAIMGSDMAMEGIRFSRDDGMVKDNFRKTLDGVVKLAKEGMRETDQVILDIMIHET